MRVCNVSPQINELGERLHRRSVRYHATQNCWEKLRRNPFSGPGNLASPFNFTVTGSLSRMQRSIVGLSMQGGVRRQAGRRKGLAAWDWTQRDLLAFSSLRSSALLASIAFVMLAQTNVA